MPHRRRIPFKKSQDDNPFFEKGKRKTKEWQTFIRINKKKGVAGRGESYELFSRCTFPTGQIKFIRTKEEKVWRRKWRKDARKQWERRGGICRIVDSQPRNPASFSILFLFEEEELIVNREQTPCSIPSYLFRFFRSNWIGRKFRRKILYALIYVLDFDTRETLIC